MVCVLLSLSCPLRAHVTTMIDKRRYCRIASYRSSLVSSLVCCCCCRPLSEPLPAINVMRMRDLEHSFIISWYPNIRDIFRLLFLLFPLLAARAQLPPLWFAFLEQDGGRYSGFLAFSLFECF